MKVFFILLFILTGSIISFSEEGKVLNSLKFDSYILGHTVKYTVYLPTGYETSNRNYPVVFLLHGATGNETDWIEQGKMKQQVDHAIANGTIPAMVIVTPEAGSSFYVNDFSSKNRWQDMFFEEFLPEIEKQFRVGTKKESRGIAGCSMGGFGSMILPMKHPELFAASVAFSPAIRSQEAVKKYDSMRAARHQSLFGGTLEPEGRITDYFLKNDPFYMAESMPVDQLNSVRWYIDCGDDDFLVDENCKLNVIWNARGIKHEFRIRDGGHDWSYWISGLIDGLKFISQSFNQ